MKTPSSKHQKLILWGMMGSGKTFLGSRLSSALNMPFIDLDQHIEEKCGLSITELFDRFGEPHFRNLEHDKLMDVLGLPHQVILALGGGTACYERNQDLFLPHFLTIYLRCSSLVLEDRLNSRQEDRPLLMSRSVDLHQRINQLLEERAIWYEQANIILDADDANVFSQLNKIASDYFHS